MSNMGSNVGLVIRKDKGGYHFGEKKKNDLAIDRIEQIGSC